MTRQLPARALCERYSVSDRTLARWLEAGILPQPIRVVDRLGTPPTSEGESQ